MNGPNRQTPTSTAGPAATVTAGRTDGPPIDLGMGRRRVTGDDLFVFHALVSGNDQTFEELSDLRPADPATVSRYARQTRPAFVTDGWLDRLNDRLTGWIVRLARAVSQWVRGRPEVPPASDAALTPGTGLRAADRGPSQPPRRAPKRAA